MNKRDIIDSIKDHCTTHAEAERIVNRVFALIENTILIGEVVRIAGFGTFQRIATKARTCRNPATGGTVEVPAGHRVKFKPAPALKG